MTDKMLAALTVLFCVALSTATESNQYQTEVLGEGGIKISITRPTYLQPGSNVIISWEMEPEASELKAEFNGQEIPIIAKGEKMFCFAGLDVRKPSGTYNFSLYRKGESEAWRQLFEYPFFFKKLRTEQKPVGKAPEQSKGFAEKYLKERTIIKQALAKSSPNVLFKGPFSIPLKGLEKITAEFGLQRLYHSPKRTSIHSGVDLRAREDTKVYAVNDGKVLLVRKFILEGNLVVIDHGGGITSSYMHLKTSKVKEGDTVKRGDVVGLSGATGNCRGAHLHLGIKVQGANVNPLEFIEMANQLFFATKAAHAK